MNSSSYHIPVMLNEVIELLDIKPEGNYIDCTLGEAGHSIAILEKLGPKGQLTSYDQDHEAIEYVKTTYTKLLSENNWILINDNFAKIDKYHDVSSVDGILMDIGMSSRQLEGLERGFSFTKPEEPLDMRMDPNLGVKASDLVNALNEKELSRLFRQFGEERFSGRIAAEVRKSNRKIESVKDLTEVIDRAVPAAFSRTKVYRRIFQALRIVVNDEIGSLTNGLERAFSLIKPKGRLVVITFHSLEDRVVKEFFKLKTNSGEAETVVRAMEPDQEEVKKNRKAHSAKLSVLIKK